MSTSASRSGPPKKISCGVRPGVFEVRASARRPVSALIRLDLPTLERPANAISGAPIGGTESSPPPAEMKTHAPANRRRPASISAAEKSAMMSALRSRSARRYRASYRRQRPTKKAKRGHSVPFFQPKQDKRSALGGRLGDAVAPLARRGRIDRVLGAALVAGGSRYRGNADLRVAAGQHRAFAMD